MKWVREQQKTSDETGFIGGQHGCLPSSVRMTAQEQTARSLAAHGGNGRSQPLLVAFCTASRRWPVGSQLAKGKIAAEHRKPSAAESVGQRTQQLRTAVGSRTVGQDETIFTRA